MQDTEQIANKNDNPLLIPKVQEELRATYSLIRETLRSAQKEAESSNNFGLENSATPVSFFTADSDFASKTIERREQIKRRASEEYPDDPLVKLADGHLDTYEERFSLFALNSDNATFIHYSFDRGAKFSMADVREAVRNALTSTEKTPDFAPETTTQAKGIPIKL